MREASRKEAGARLKETSNYVTSMSIRSFLEYISVELLTALPADPFIFTRNLLDLKVAERINSDYEPANTTDYLKAIYSEISEHGDEHGRIPRRVSKGSGVKTDEVEKLTARAQKYEALMRAACDMLSNLGARELQESAVQNCTALFEADRAHLFVHREASHDLVSRTGPSELIVPVGKGVVGSVAATGEIINLKDAYDDPRFDDLLDRIEGNRSHLAVPVKALDGRLLGVVHANNRPHSFSQLDEEVMTAYAQLLGVAMANAARHEEVSMQSAQLRSVLDCVSGLQPDLGGKHLLMVLSAKLPTLICAERCLCYYVDHRKGQLVAWSGPAGIPVKVPLGKGVSGMVASMGQSLRVQDADKDPRFASTEDLSSEKPLTRNILSLPIRVSTTVLGVLELSNQSETGRYTYTPADEELMTRLAAAVAPILLAALKSGADNLEAPRLEVVE